jgi:hypothetical protein
MDIAVERYHGAVFGSLALGTLAGTAVTTNYLLISRKEWK